MANPQQRKLFDLKVLAMDEVVIPSGTPWKMAQERILRNHNKLVRNFNQLLTHLLTTRDNHPHWVAADWGKDNPWVVGIDELVPLKQEDYAKIKGWTKPLPTSDFSIIVQTGSRQGGKSWVQKQYINALDCKALLRQFRYFCECVCPVGEDDDYCKTCGRIIIEKER